MIKNTHNIIQFKRKREGLTNYKKRLKLLASNRMRLVVRKSLNNIVAQVVDYDEKGDIVVVSAHSIQLRKLGWKFANGNVPAAYLTGLMLGKKAKEKKLDNLVLDAGVRKPTKGSRTYAVVKGVVDAGITIPHSADILPSEDRLVGTHITSYIKKIDPQEYVNNFKAVKDKLFGGR